MPGHTHPFSNTPCNKCTTDPRQFSCEDCRCHLDEAGHKGDPIERPDQKDQGGSQSGDEFDYYEWVKKEYPGPHRGHGSNSERFSPFI